MTKEIELTFCESVLILIVVDNGLVQHQIGVWRKCTVGLNPYCSGQWSRTVIQQTTFNKQQGLNPYCSGQWSRTQKGWRDLFLGAKSLNPYCSGQWSRTSYENDSDCKLIRVLILIVVDNGLVLVEFSTPNDELHTS